MRGHLADTRCSHRPGLDRAADHSGFAQTEPGEHAALNAHRAGEVRGRDGTDCRGHQRIWLGDPARMQSMAKTLTADDILPLVASLTPRERVRLLRLIALPQGSDAPVYRSVPPSRDEFSADDEPLAWDAEGWEDVG